MVKMTTANGLERLEGRVLLAHIGADLNFGQLGFATADAEGSIVLQPDGEILVFGSEPDGNQAVLRIGRLNADGSPGATFIAAPPPPDEISSGASVYGERLLVVGTARPLTQPLGPYSIIVRVLDINDGSADETFGDGGIVRIPIESPDP